MVDGFLLDMMAVKRSICSPDDDHVLLSKTESCSRLRIGISSS